MARSSSRSRQNNNPDRFAGRDPSRIAKPRLPQRVNLREIEDRRIFHPDAEIRPARTLRGLPARSRVVSDPRPIVQSGLGSSFGERFSAVPYSLGFQNPSRVSICVRRYTRRQVLHAKGVAGSRGLRPPRFGYYSKISCKG